MKFVRNLTCLFIVLGARDWPARGRNGRSLAAKGGERWEEEEEEEEETKRFACWPSSLRKLKVAQKLRAAAPLRASRAGAIF